jgi:hypothetical protein
VADTEADKLRSNFAKYIAPEYLNEPERIAAICDGQLDQSGRLLGMVRTEARALFGRRQAAFPDSGNGVCKR